MIQSSFTKHRFLFRAFQTYCKDFRGNRDLRGRIFFLFLLGCDLQIMFLPECVPPPVRLEPAEVEVRGLGVGAAELQLPDQVDDGAVAELVLVLLAVADHLLLLLGLQIHLGQDGCLDRVAVIDGQLLF